MPKKGGRPPRDHSQLTPAWARRLREMRESRGLSIGELADATLLSRDTVASYDAGKHEPSVSAAITLARYFGVSVEQLFG